MQKEKKKTEAIIDQIEVCNENDFRNYFNIPKSDHFWQTINFVQTCVKAKKGFGKEFVVEYYAPLDVAKPEDEIKYDYRSLGDDVDILSTNEYKYCVKQCYKMCFYVQKIYNIEILRMKCEFLKDENNSIWLTYASNISTRSRLSREEEQFKVNVRKAINKDHQAQLL